MAVIQSFDKKKIIFIGNSFTFFGKCVNVKTFDEVDDGYFYKLAQSFGEDVTVTNFTWGGASFWHKGDGFASRMLYEKLKELGYNVPEDISVVGYDNHIYSTISSPRITTIDVNSYRMYHEAVEIIIKKIL
mgnify:CR=1 FL=1